MSKLDLHIHSEFSNDGEFSVGKIIEMCIQSGMKLISITDHNSVKSAAEANKYDKVDLKIISGVELDCTYKGMDFHLLGYTFDYTNNDFRFIEEDIHDQEIQAAEKKISLFSTATGIPVNNAEIIAAAKDGIVTGELIAEIILVKENAQDYPVLQPYLPGGEKSDLPYVNMYWDFFSQGKAAYTPINYINLKDAIDLIHTSGGFSVLAHPGKTLGKYPGKNLNAYNSLLNDITSEGIDGIEVFSSYHSREESEFFLDYAKQNKLFISCGSDFHGKTKPSIQIGGHGAFLEDKELLKHLFPFS